VEDAIQYFQNGPVTKSSFDYGSAAQIASRSSWSMFASDDSDVVAFRKTLTNILTRDSPPWARLIPFGRQVLLRNLSINERQCFEIAQLVDAIDRETVDWWDESASSIRDAREDPRMAIGREAERKSFEREMKLLAGKGKTPTWVALDDNTFGCDIQSWRSGCQGWDDAVAIYIEVKASSLERHCFISKREWEFAVRHGKSWELQYWHLDAQSPEIFKFADLEVHIPLETGSGVWTSVKIELSNIEGHRSDN